MFVDAYRGHQTIGLHCGVLLSRLAPPVVAFEPGKAPGLLQPHFEELVADSTAATGGDLRSGPGPINGPDLLECGSARTQSGVTSNPTNDARCAALEEAAREATTL